MKDKTSMKPKGQAAVPFWKMLQMVFPDVQCERRFPWLTLPRGEEASDIELKIRNALVEHCRSTNPTQTNHKKKDCTPEQLAKQLAEPPRPRLEFDFFVLSLNLAFEFDERQHFTLERAVSLNAYEEEVKTYYDINGWIKKCDEIQAVDVDPVWRDWQRAYRDAVRDIRADVNGIRLVRYAYDDIPSADDLRRFL